MNAKRLLAVTLIVVAVYAAIAFWGDVNKLREALGSYAWWTFAAALALASGNYVLRFFKWEYYLRRLDIRDVPASESFTIFLAGFVMSVTPAKAGEVFKSALLASARGVPVARSAPIVVADRLTDLTALIILVALGGLQFKGGLVPAAVAAAMVLTIIVFVIHRPLGEAMIALVSRTAFGARLAPRLREAYESLRILAGPSALAIPTPLSVVAWGLEALGLWVILHGLGHPVSLPLAFFVYATATIAGAVAMLPGGVGGTEATMIALLLTLSAHAAQGAVPEGVARAATLLVRLATLWFAVGVGGLALAFFRQRYDRGLAASSPPSEPAMAGPDAAR